MTCCASAAGSTRLGLLNARISHATRAKLLQTHCLVLSHPLPPSQRGKQLSMERKRALSEEGRERARLAARPDEAGAALTRPAAERKTLDMRNASCWHGRGALP